MKYREHRELLSESLATVTEVDSLEELKTLLEKQWQSEIKTIIFDHVGLDERINWDTYYVICTFKNKQWYPDKVVTGMSDGKL